MQGPTAALMCSGVAPNLTHCRNDRIRDSGQRSLPARVRSTDDPRLRIAKQDRRAIGREDSKHDAGPVRHQTVGAWDFALISQGSVTLSALALWT